jgi:predicted nucleotide-binding protein (sugar kinase/HSP70/actin superfamily)
MRNDRPASGPSLRDRTLYIPRMSFSAARCVAASFRSAGIDTHPFPPSDAETLELGGRYTSGEECFPERVTLGDVLRIVMAPGARPEKLAFFMPTAPGPCRFGQYAPFLRKVLDSVGAEEAMVFSPTSGTGYDNAGGKGVQRAGWRALLVSDLLRKALLRVRPYEMERGACDALYETSLRETCDVLAMPGISTQESLRLRSRRSRDATRSAS